MTDISFVVFDRTFTAPLKGHPTVEPHRSRVRLTLAPGMSPKLETSYCGSEIGTATLNALRSSAQDIYPRTDMLFFLNNHIAPWMEPLSFATPSEACVVDRTYHAFGVSRRVQVFVSSHGKVRLVSYLNNSSYTDTDVEKVQRYVNQSYSAPDREHFKTQVLPWFTKETGQAAKVAPTSPTGPTIVASVAIPFVYPLGQIPSVREYRVLKLNDGSLALETRRTGGCPQAWYVESYKDALANMKGYAHSGQNLRSFQAVISPYFEKALVTTQPNPDYKAIFNPGEYNYWPGQREAELNKRIGDQRKELGIKNETIDRLKNDVCLLDAEVGRLLKDNRLLSETSTKQAVDISTLKTELFRKTQELASKDKRIADLTAINQRLAISTSVDRELAQAGYQVTCFFDSASYAMAPNKGDFMAQVAHTVVQNLQRFKP